MDTGKEYILMCEKATGIQGECSYYDDDVIKTEYEPKTVVVLRQKGVDVYSGTWLPKQDQLQEMCKRDDGASLWGQIGRLYAFIENNPALQKITWEKVWLCYLMMWEYNKVWNGEEWVNDK